MFIHKGVSSTAVHTGWGKLGAVTVLCIITACQQKLITLTHIVETEPEPSKTYVGSATL
jgi:hypothetical protein